MNDNNWVSVYSNKQMYLVEMAKQMLLDHDINAIIFNNKDSAYLFGYIEIHVPKEDAKTAKYLIEQFENNLQID
jgi:hypothetical protein